VGRHRTAATTTVDDARLRHWTNVRHRDPHTAVVTVSAQLLGRYAVGRGCLLGARRPPHPPFVPVAFDVHVQLVPVSAYVRRPDSCVAVAVKVGLARARHPGARRRMSILKSCHAIRMPRPAWIAAAGDATEARFLIGFAPARSRCRRCFPRIPTSENRAINRVAALRHLADVTSHARWHFGCSLARFV
jgi:hypothetical protein